MLDFKALNFCNSSLPSIVVRLTALECHDISLPHAYRTLVLALIQACDIKMILTLKYVSDVKLAFKFKVHAP